MRIIIIGRGNVAVNLQLAFQRKGITVPMLSSREGLRDMDRNADVYIYAVKDHAMQEVIAQVHTERRALHLHTSGTLPMTIFGEDKPHCGILYPIYTFSKSKPIEDFTQVPVFIEAKGIDDITALYTLALNLTNRVYEATQADRARLHIAGVFANNFTNCMYGIAKELLRGSSIPFEALLPIIDETAAKVHTLDPKVAQTGPAIRGDRNVLAEHIKNLPTDELREIYRTLSKYINPSL